MNILQINKLDAYGGAARASWSLFRSYQRRGLGSWLAVDHKSCDDPYVLKLFNGSPQRLWARSCRQLSSQLRDRAPSTGLRWGLSRALNGIAEPFRSVDYFLGREDFHFPATKSLLSKFPVKPDLIHCHNLHGGYFDLRMLRSLSKQVPLVLTLHDLWLLSGHCAHSFDCERWKHGCGQCPDLDIYPKIRRDATAHNWRRKKSIYSQSRLYIASPCRWLMDKVSESILLAGCVQRRIIEPGVDLSVFKPGDKLEARARLGLPLNVPILLFSATGIRENPWKDFKTMQSAFGLLSSRLRKRILFIGLGEDAASEHFGESEIRFIPYQQDERTVARYLQATDIYLHAARAEVWGLSITEALACGVPVVATAVGGIPEQIEDGVTGFLIPAGESNMMAERVAQLLEDPELLARISENAAHSALQRFSSERMADDYIAWYEEILSTSSIPNL